VSLGSVRTAGGRDADAIEATVFAASASDVTDVVVDGRRIVTDGRHVEIDVAAELHAAITELMDR
jgi:cytosine/adenosine deaminase-related metal-dependent hydrolase